MHSVATQSAASSAASAPASSAYPSSPGPISAASSTPLLGSQILGILITIVFVGVLDVVIGLIVKACFKGSLRVSEEEEAQGLDVAAHGESAYPAYIGLD